MPAAMALTPQGELLLADQANNRVVLYPSSPTQSGQAATAVLGQHTLDTAVPSVSRNGLSGPFGLAAGGGKVAVADFGANRVLLFNGSPRAGAPAAEAALVIGQPDFQSNLASCGSQGLTQPAAVVITPDGKLIVADTWNHRVLIWNSVPTGPTVPGPDRVLGQSLRNSCELNAGLPSGQATASTLAMPADIWSDGTRLAVADSGNHRVLVWSDINLLTGDFQPANLVLGHTNFTTTTANTANEVEGPRAQPTISTLNDPEGGHSDGTSLAVADSFNNRVLIWRTFPDRNFQPADVVLGHETFEQSTTNDTNNDGATDVPTAHVLNYPIRVLLTPDALLVSDYSHNRVLKFGR